MYPLNEPITAIVRSLPATFAKALTQNPSAAPIDVELAQEQHAVYVQGLKDIVRKVVVLPADVNFPDCCFIEDTAVIVGNKAAISYLGAPSRRGEEKIIRVTLKECGLRTMLIEFPGTLDGGDVLFTGKHLIVGLSKRTNEFAARQLAEIFSEVPVVTVKVGDSLHLKSVMSAFDPEMLLFGDCDPARLILQQLQEQNVIEGNYGLAFIPDPVSANVLNLGSSVFIQDGFPNSDAIFNELGALKNKQIYKLSMSELIKADGALTCCSLLF